MHMYNFDEIIDRANTNSVSFEGWRQSMFGLDKDAEFPFDDRDYIRLWVADMDFATPPEVLDAIREHLDRKILGYTRIYDDNYFAVLSSWFRRRYEWTIREEDMVISPGIVPALNRLVGLLTEPGENILIHTPAYAPFKHAGDYHGRQVFYSPLIQQEGYYTIDFDDMERQLADRAKNIKLFILCHPHNPTGRVWSEEELRKMGDLCQRHDIWIISDEIHCDLLRKGQQHMPLAKLFPDNDRIITCTAPSKTFNLAGSPMSHLFIPHKAMRKEWLRLYAEVLSPLSIVATQTAYASCGGWLEQLKQYLDDNFVFLQAQLEAQAPNVRFHIPESTYLAWVDISAYLEHRADKNNVAMDFAQHGVLIEDGKMFVHNAEGYIRINIACPRAVLAEGIQRMVKALHSL